MMQATNNSLIRKQFNKEKQDEKERRARNLLWPTPCEQWGATALISSDLYPQLNKSLAPFSATGKQVFFWRSMGESTTLTQSAVSDTAYTLSFTLAGANGYADLIQVFDQYRIMAVSIEMTPQYEYINGTNISPRLYSCIDYDDASTTTRANILAYDTCIVNPPNTGCVRTLIPRSAVAAYTGTFTGYQNVEQQWIDAASSTVQHYGLKMIVESGTTGQTSLQSYTVDITYFIEFRASR